MQKEFNKYQGAGNDFIMIDNRDDSFPVDNQVLISKLCNRRFGIGADGLILLSQHQDLDYEMHYFNSDGKRGTMCGNGGRCAYAYALKMGIVSGESSFMASDGVHKANIVDNEIFQISMNDVMSPALISGCHFLDTGSPHYIIPVPSVDNIDVEDRGRAIRWSKQFAPEGTNVNFIEILDNYIKVRTYERGVETETLSCGTGVTASAISSRWGTSYGENRVIVETRGGELEVSFYLSEEKAENVYLKGPAEKVFTGTIDFDSYK